MKYQVNNIILKLLGILLLAAAVLKGHELLTTPMANADIWSNRYFMIFQVEFELALGIWLLSGLFRRVAWLVVLGCFTLFCCVTLYKGLTGAASCGCFGNVHVNPWVTLFAIDLPAVVSLLLFRPKIETQKVLNLMHWLQPRPTFMQFCVVFLVGFSAIAVSSPVLLLNEPKMVTSQYEVLEPETWIGKELPILDHIDIGDQLKTGKWLVMLYHYDCPDCIATIPKIEQMAREMQGNEDVLKFAIIEVPPYGPEGVSPVNSNTFCALGKLDTNKEWFVTSPAIIGLNGTVRQIFDHKLPILTTDNILTALSVNKEKTSTIENSKTRTLFTDGEDSNEILEATKRIESVAILQNAPVWIHINSLLIGTNTKMQNISKDIVFGTKDKDSIAFETRREKPWPIQTQDGVLGENYKDEFLYLFALSKIPYQQPIYINGRQFTLLDLLDNSKEDCWISNDIDLGRTTFAYAHYLGPGKKWKNKYGQKMELGILVKAIMEKSANEYLSLYEVQAIASILSDKKWNGDKIIYNLQSSMQQVIEKSKINLKKTQGLDGSLLSIYKNEPDVNALTFLIAYKMFYTSSSLEWLSLVLNEKELNEDWIVNSYDYLAFAVDKYRAISIGNDNKRDLLTYGTMCHTARVLRYRNKPISH